MNFEKYIPDQVAPARARAPLPSPLLVRRLWRERRCIYCGHLVKWFGQPKDHPPCQGCGKRALPEEIDLWQGVELEQAMIDADKRAS